MDDDPDATRGHALAFTLLVEEPRRIEVTFRRVTAAGWHDQWTGLYPPDDFHIPLQLRGHIPDSSFSLPAALRGRLVETLGSDGTDLPLWIQLREPFGYLGLVPWAALLAGIFNGPVLRLPTLSLPRRPVSDSLQVALLAAVPYEHRSSSARLALHSQAVTIARTAPTRSASPTADDHGTRPRPDGNREPLKARHLDHLVRAVLDGSPRRRTTIHVVTTPWIHDDLRLLWRGRRHPGEDRVTLHNPRTLASHVDRSPRPSSHNFWLRLLARAQGDEQADVVHLVSHGSVVQTSSRLVFADSLRTRRPDLASRYVSSSALRAALDALGAWSVCLSSPPEHARVPQLRYFATRLVEQRPGPLLLTDLEADPQCHDVRAGYRFLYAPRPSDPPRLEHALLATEPHRVRGFPEHAGGLTHVVQAPPSERPQQAVREVLSSENTPAWVAGVQRFIEQQQVEIARLERDAPIGSRQPEAEYRTQGIRDALAVLQEALEAELRDGGGRA